MRNRSKRSVSTNGSARARFRSALVFGHDLFAAALALTAAYFLRFNLSLPAEAQADLLRALAWIVPLQGTVFLIFRLYRGIWRYASLPDLQHILVAVGVAALLVPAAVLMLRVHGIPRSVLVLDPLLLAGMMCGSRLAYRAWKEFRAYGVFYKAGKPVLVLGAGAAAVNLVKELSRGEEWRVVGLLDDSPDKRGRLLHGNRVLGALGEMSHWAAKLGAQHAIIAMPSATHAQRRRAVDLCTRADLTVLTVPTFADLVSGKVKVSQVREVEVEDLLGRESVVLDNQGLHGFLSRRVVLVTGAGGSIGSELCRQIARFNPNLLLLLEQSEYALYQVSEEFRASFPHVQIEAVVGDVKNSARVQQVLRRYRPHVVFHAAAYKHVPLMEEVNSWEAIRNNVFGTYVMARAALEHGVERFVLVSTDKAVNPVNVMGASKRLAEMVCQSLQNGGKTRFAMVRFGNVLGSTGSVIPKFREQIEKGGPLTVTHPDVIRYFMSIPEAAQLVLQAGSMGLGGEIFVMDMGEPVRIVDLARDMIRLSGFSGDDIKIEFTGLRRGEKLFEELLADGEDTLPTPHPKLRIAKARLVNGAWLEQLLEWLKQERVLDDQEVRRDLKRWVPEYSNEARVQLKVVGASAPQQ